MKLDTYGLLFIFFPSATVCLFVFFCVKILDDDAAQELMPVVAGAVFTLTAHLSQSVKTEQKQPLAVPMTGQSQYVLMLDGSFTSSPGSESISMGFASIGDSSLHVILKKLLDFILKTGICKACVRVLTTEGRKMDWTDLFNKPTAVKFFLLQSIRWIFQDSYWCIISDIANMKKSNLKKAYFLKSEQSEESVNYFKGNFMF